jgi:hypothetical protein
MGRLSPWNFEFQVTVIERELAGCGENGIRTWMFYFERDKRRKIVSKRLKFRVFSSGFNHETWRL